METSPPLKSAVEAFLKRNNMSAITFGRLAMKDPHFVRDLRNGRRLWPETEEKIREFMASYAPAPKQDAAA